MQAEALLVCSCGMWGCARFNKHKNRSSYLSFLGRTLFCLSAVCASTRRSQYRPSTLEAPKSVSNTAVALRPTAPLPKKRKKKERNHPTKVLYSSSVIIEFTNILLGGVEVLRCLNQQRFDFILNRTPYWKRLLLSQWKPKETASYFWLNIQREQTAAFECMLFVSNIQSSPWRETKWPITHIKPCPVYPPVFTLLSWRSIRFHKRLGCARNIKKSSEDGGKAFLRNIDKYVPNYTTSHPRIWEYSAITRASKFV